MFAHRKQNQITGVTAVNQDIYTSNSIAFLPSDVVETMFLSVGEEISGAGYVGPELGLEPMMFEMS